jgi:hypothetical protein
MRISHPVSWTVRHEGQWTQLRDGWDLGRCCAALLWRREVRINLSIRMHVGRLTRLTNAHSKTLTNHKAVLALWFAFYNSCRKHLTLKTMPAVAGITAEPWSLEMLLTEAAKTIAA